MKRDPLRPFAQMIAALPRCRFCSMPAHPEDAITIISEESASGPAMVPDSFSEIQIEPDEDSEHLGIYCSLRCVKDHWAIIGYTMQHDEEEDEDDWALNGEDDEV